MNQLPFSIPYRERLLLADILVDVTCLNGEKIPRTLLSIFMTPNIKVAFKGKELDIRQASGLICVRETSPKEMFSLFYDDTINTLTII